MAKEAARRARIGKRAVDAATKEKARYTVWDTELTGFGLRVAPSGVKVYIARYRVGGGRSGVLRQQVIGRHGVLTPEEARDEAKLILAASARGEDPQTAKLAKRAELTVSALCDLYLAEGCSTKKASTIYVDKFRVARHIKPLLGAKKLSAVAKADVERLMADIASGKTKTKENPQATGGKPAASRTVALLAAIYGFAISRKLARENPARGVKRYKDQRRERFLSAAEMGKLGDAIKAFEADGGDWQVAAILRLLALSGGRKNEIAHLKWAEVDIARSMLRLGDSKTGQKVVQIGAAALEVLSEIERGPGPYVFPRPDDAQQPYHAVDYRWRGIRDAAGLGGVRVHDLRHSYASTGLAAGQGLVLLGKLLGHAHTATTSRYAHLDADPIKAAADNIAGKVAAALKGESAEIRPIQQGAGHGS